MRLPTRAAKIAFRPGNRMRAKGYAAMALVRRTSATEPIETTALLRKARPIRAVREELKSTSR
jgi:hypothetical protein